MKLETDSPLPLKLFKGSSFWFFSPAACPSGADGWQRRISSLTKCLLSGWVFYKWGKLINFFNADSRFNNSSLPGLIGVFKVPDLSCPKLRISNIKESSTSIQSIFMVSKLFLVARSCQRHLILSSIVEKVGNSVQDVDVWHLIKSPRVPVHYIQKIVQASVFPFVQCSGDYQGHEKVGKLFCLDWYANEDYRE